MNSYLFFQLEQKQKQILKCQEEVDQYGERVHSMSGHLKNVEQERTQTQVYFFISKKISSFVMQFKSFQDSAS